MFSLISLPVPSQQMTMFFIAIVVSAGATSASVVDLRRLEEMRICDNSSAGQQRSAFERDLCNHVALPPAKSQQQRPPSVLHSLCGFDRQSVASNAASIPPCSAIDASHARVHPHSRGASRVRILRSYRPSQERAQGRPGIR
jgi:hypothetical protein